MIGLLYGRGLPLDRVKDTDRLVIDHTIDSLSEDIGYRHDVDLIRVLTQGDGVGEDHFLERRSPGY